VRTPAIVAASYTVLQLPKASRPVSRADLSSFRPWRRRLRAAIVTAQISSRRALTLGPPVIGWMRREWVVFGGSRVLAVVLIVEDDAFTRELLEMTLKDAGYQTVSASDVGGALVVLESSQDIDVLVTDIYLKTAILGGCELARKAIEIRPTLRVLYTTGNLVTPEMKALFIEGAAFLHKPYMSHQLQHSIEALLAA
jgi:CheY-like chemotaxis protein